MREKLRDKNQFFALLPPIQIFWFCRKTQRKLDSELFFLQNLEKQLVKKDVISGHVIPNKLVFTEPLDRAEEKTSTYSDSGSSIKVTAVIQATREGCKSTFFDRE